MFFKNNNQFDEAEAWRIEQAEKEQRTAEKNAKMTQRFNRRFNNRQSFITTYADTRQFVEWLSYLVQLMSAAVAYKGGRVLMEWVPIPYLDVICAAGMLFLIEIAKRKYSDKFWDQLMAKQGIAWGAAFINITILIFSMFLSGFGGYFTVADNSKEAKLMGTAGDPEAVALQDQIKQVQADIEYHKGNKNEQGVVYWPSQEAIKELEGQKATLSKTLKEKHGVYNIANQNIIQEWGIRVWYQKWGFLGFVIILELLFEAMMAFRSYYDYRYWLVEMHRGPGGGTPPSQRSQFLNQQDPVLNNASSPVASQLQHEPPTGARKQVQGFKGNPPNPETKPTADPEERTVATGSYSVATDKKRKDMLVQALKNANSNITSWECKKDSEAKRRNLKKYEGIYDQAAAELMEMGVSISDVLRKRTAAATD